MNIGGSSNDYRLVESLFQRALDLTPEQRPAFLERHCGSDPVLRGSVETLLRHHAAVPETYPSMLEGHRRQLAALGPAHQQSRTSIEALVNLYTAWNKPDQLDERKAKLPQPAESHP